MNANEVIADSRKQEEYDVVLPLVWQQSFVKSPRILGSMRTCPTGVPLCFGKI
jgi:hypothetical protein